MQKRRRVNDITIRIRINGRRKKVRKVLAKQGANEATGEGDEAGSQARLQKVEEELAAAKARISDLTQKISECNVQLQAEMEINKLAEKYIPEERYNDFVMEWPTGQVEWRGSPPAS